MKCIFATMFICVALQLATVVSHSGGDGLGGENLEKTKIRLFQFPGAGAMPGGSQLPGVGGIPGGMCPPGTQQGPCPSGLPNIPGAISICCHGHFPGK